MKKKTIIVLATLLTVAAWGYSNTFSFKLNYFMPRAQNGPNWPNGLWTKEFNLMSYTKSNFQDTSYGFAYEYFLTQQFSIVIGIDSFSKNKSGYYKDYVGYEMNDGLWAFDKDYASQNSFLLSHRLNIMIMPIQISFKITPFGRRSKFIPYISAGGSLNIWSVRIQGDQIYFKETAEFEDFYGNSLLAYRIYPVDIWEGQGFGKISFGYQVSGGLMFPVANRMTLDIEFKYTNAKGKLTGAFQEFGFFDIDIGGYQIALGINYWF